MVIVDTIDYCQSHEWLASFGRKFKMLHVNLILRGFVFVVLHGSKSRIRLGFSVQTI